ncbi:hypothetical protein FG167_12965 [Lacinutrix sp. WUR7]|uniref:hypothetical protein n=1 Tax=Lacinutrix sp. WUR7 TaxID=2653681 RepID=UPI00193D21D6|nr:hypothetical protein [Lacinutrix sp. WUR7]QRM90105.1 hypothetical protein FG167_12965 [Lacinutrix sp. WUR7]
MNLITAIQNTIFDTVLAAYADTSGDPSSSPYQNEEIVMGRLWPCQIIDENQYGNAWSPTNPNGVMAATENLSILVDPIPNISNSYSKSGRNVETMYAFMLNGADADLSSSGTRSAQTSSKSTNEKVALLQNVRSELEERKEVVVSLPDNSKIKTLRMTPESIKKKNLEIAHSNAAAAALAFRLANKKAQVNTRSKKTENTEDPISQLDKAKRKAWKELKKVDVLTTPSNPNLQTTSSVENSFHEANLIFTRSTLASVSNPGISYHPSYTSPENWVDPTAKINWPLLTIPVADTNPPVRLTITFSRIDITRPWLVSSLFELDGWKTPQGAGSLSNGKLTNNNGNFSLIPQSMIVARDIVASTPTETVFRATGLQVLAYISKLVPFSPPL